MFFFVQGDGGKRDLVGSRGRGVVYKRQPLPVPACFDRADHQGHHVADQHHDGLSQERGARSVSYTHLTLPTSDLV